MNIIITLLIATLGGAIAHRLGLPIPWLLGSLLIVFFCKKLPIIKAPPKAFSRWVRVFLGVAIGASVGNTASNIEPSAVTTLVLSVVFVLTVTFFGVYYFKRLNNFTTLDSFMSALPGGLTFLFSLSDNLGHRFPKIALIHTVRMVTLILTFSIFAYFIEHPQHSANTSILNAIAFTYDSELWKVIILTLLSGIFAKKCNIAGGDIMFPIIIAASLYHYGVIETPMPEIIKTIAMITFGTVIACKLAISNVNEFKEQIRASIIFTIAIISVAFAISLGLGITFDKHYFLFFLALAPGSIPEISLIAIALGYDVGFVAMIHTCRYLFIMLIGALGFHIFKNKEADGATNIPIPHSTEIFDSIVKHERENKEREAIGA